MTETPLLLTREGPVARLTLNRPQSLNALTVPIRHCPRSISIPMTMAATTEATPASELTMPVCMPIRATSVEIS